MQLILVLILLAMLTGGVWPRVAKWRASSAEERSFTIRFTVFVWLVGFLFVAAFLFLPNKGRIIMLLPVFLVSVSLAKWWKNSRARLRRAAEMQSNFARARRIN